MRSLGTKKDLAGGKTWLEEKIGRMNVWPCSHLPESNGPMRPLWHAGRVANGRSRKTPKNTAASGRSYGCHTLNPRTRKRGKLQAVSMLTKPMHRVIFIMDEISS